MTTDKFLARIGRAAVEVLLVLVPMFIVGCSVFMVLP